MPPPPIVDRRYQQALDVFERAVKALGRKDFDRSRDLLDGLIDGFADQQELVERAKTYRTVCERTRPARPKTFEELLNYGVVLHNRGDFAARRQVPAPGARHPPQERERPLLHGRSPGPGGGRSGGAQGAQVGDPRRTRRAGPRPGGTRTSSPCERRRPSRPWSRRLSDGAGGTRSRALAAGVRVEDPATTFVGDEVVVEKGAVLRPFTMLEGRTTIRAGAVIGPFVRLVDVEVGPGAEILDHCLLRQSVVEAGASVGPFAHLRPDSRVGERRARSATSSSSRRRDLGAGSKADHLSYLGDATIGPGANIGAGTITCNYDGVAQAPDAHRGGGVRRQRHDARRAGHDRRRRLRRRRQHGHAGRAEGRARRSPAHARSRSPAGPPSGASGRARAPKGR